MSIDTSELTKALECGICLNIISNPKNLACNHSFCKHCLDKILNFTPYGSATIKCPNGCQKETTLSAVQTTNDLEMNYMLKSVLDVAVKSERNEQPNKRNCATCSRLAVRYCTICSVFRCDKCVDEHNDNNRDFVFVDFSSRREGSGGIVVCNEHRSEATHVCCERQYVCVYCMHRGVHCGHVHVPLVQCELDLKRQMIGMVEANPQHEKRLQDTIQDLDTAEQALDEELTCLKMQRLAEYLTFLDREEAEIKDLFKRWETTHLSAFQSVAYFKKVLKLDEFRFRLERSKILGSMNSLIMDGSDCIPGTILSLVNDDGTCPIASLHAVHCDGKRSKQIQFRSGNIDRIEALRQMTKLESAMEETRKVLDRPSRYIGGMPYSFTSFFAANGKGSSANNVTEDEVSNEQVNTQNNDVDKHLCQALPIPDVAVKTTEDTLKSTFVVSSVSKVRGYVYSEPVTLGNYIFRLQLEREVDGEGETYAGIYLYCDYKGLAETWSIKPRVKFILKNRHGHDKHQKLLEVFDKDHISWGWAPTQWDELVDPENGYIDNDSVSIEATIVWSNQA